MVVVEITPKNLKTLRFPNKHIANQIFVSSTNDRSNMTKQFAVLNNDRDVVRLAILEPSTWDTKQLGISTMRLRLLHTTLPVSINESRKFVSTVLEKARNLNSKLIITRLPLDNIQMIHSVESNGGILCDVLVTFESVLPNNSLNAITQENNSVQSRKSNMGDVKLIRSIARQSFRWSHFYVDPNIPSEKADRLFEAWVTNLIKDENCTILVTEYCDNITGFVTCKSIRNENGEHIGIIDLIAVVEHYRRKGYGSVLLKGAISLFGKLGAQKVLVGTQASNLASMRLYETHGFRACKIEATFHLWL